MKERVGLFTDGVLEEMKLKISLRVKKKKISERLQQRLDYENSSDFYHCGNEDCSRMTFENALEAFFKCSTCGKIVNLKKNDKVKKALSYKIDDIKKNIRN